MGRPKCLGTEALRSLHAPEMRSADGLLDHVTVDSLQSLVQGNRYDRSLGILERRKSAFDHLSGDERSRRVVDDNVARGNVLEAPAHGLLPAVAAGDHHATLSERGADSIDRLRRHDKDQRVASVGQEHVQRPLNERATIQFLKLLECGPACSFAASAGRDDRRNRAGDPVGYPSTSSSIFSASSSLQFFEKVSSDTRIWRALVSMRFSPADRPFSWSRWWRLRTTSATW